jgi:hypothetical protein
LVTFAAFCPLQLTSVRWHAFAGLVT